MYYNNEYGERKQKLVQIFEDTQKFYTTDLILKDYIQENIEHTVVYDSNEYPELIETNFINKKAQIEVNALRTFESAMQVYKQYGKNVNIGVLNFASATNPGGGVKKGSSAQEECLCRCSTLYPSLSQPKIYQKFYNVNRNMKDCLHTDAIIYSPNILIIKTDEQFPVRLATKDWIKVDVLSCAAPNLRDNHNSYADKDSECISISDTELYDLHVKRAKHILHIAAFNKIDILILGAFGCGAFKNNPRVVAKAYNEALKNYKKYFDKIIFSVFCTQRDMSNFNVFKQFIEV